MREATPMERAEWKRWVDYYEGPVTQAVVRFHLAATIAGDTQSFLDARGILLRTGPVFTMDDAERTKSLLNAYNSVGRMVQGVNSWKYGIRLTQGDIDVLAPPGLPDEEWQSDVYTLGAIPLIIYALAVGGILVAGLWSGAAMMESSAKKDYTKYKKAILEADKQMMKAAPDVRSAWIQRRKDFEEQEQKTEEKTGILVDIFGTRGGGAIAAVAIGLVALFALRFMPKGQSK